MDRLNQLRGGGAGSSRDSSADGSGAGDSFLTANDTPSKYYSLSEDESFDNDITKDVSLATTSAESTLNSSDCFPNLSPIGKIDYKIGKQIEAANILSGGVNIFDDNDNSYDGNELVIDDNVEIDKSPNLKSPDSSSLPLDDVEKASTSKECSGKLQGKVESENDQTLKLPGSGLPFQDNNESENDQTLKLPGSGLPFQDNNELSKPSFKLPAEISVDKVDDQPMEIIQQVVEEPPVNTVQLNQGNLLDHALLEEVEGNINGEQLEIAHIPLDNGEAEQIANLPLDNEEIAEANLPNDNGEANLPNDNSEENIPDNNAEEDRTEVVLQIDGNNVAAISIGTGLYLYRKEGQDELAAVQIVKEPQEEEPSFKFLKVRENAEGNLEVYEEIQEVVVVPQETPMRERPAPAAPSTSKDGNKPVVCEPSTSKEAEKKDTTPKKDAPVASTSKQDTDPKESQADRTERNLNGKMVKFSESRKSPLMVHSTPNKEGIPLTKTMVDQQLHPNRHSDNIKKTIEVHTDNCKQKILESPSTSKNKDVASPDKAAEETPAVDKPVDKDSSNKKHISIVTKEVAPDIIEKKTDEIPSSSNAKTSDKVELTSKLNEDEAKVLMIGKLMESVKVPMAKEKEKIIQDEPEDKSKKSNAAPSTRRVEIPTASVCKGNKTEGKQPLTLKQPLPTTHTDAKEISPSLLVATSSVPMGMDNSLLKTSISDKSEVKLVSPTGIMESADMEVDEEVLVIEEQIIENQPEECESQKTEVETIVPAVEIKSTMTDNQMKNILETGEIKPITSFKNKASDAETLQTNSSSINVTTDQIIDKFKPDKMDRTIASSVNDLKTNTIKSDKVTTENKPETQIKTYNLSKIEVKGTNPRDPQLNHNIKITQNELIKQTTFPGNKLNKNVEKSLNVKESVEMKPIEKNFTERKSAALDPSIPSAKVNNLTVNNMSNKSDNVIAKLESTYKNSEKKEASPIANIKDLKNTSLLLPGKEQPQSRLPINTQSLIKPQMKSDIKPPIINLAEAKREINHKLTNAVDSKPKSINNNHAPVPFGKWTEANRQDFLNKIKESKPVNISNANQIKQPNDLNRRDVLKKIDSQRQTYNAHVKIQESLNKGNVKAEAFASKTAPATVTKIEPKVSVKPEAPVVKPKPIVEKKPEKEPQNIHLEPIVAASASSTTIKEQRKEINNQHLIDKTIEGIINRAVTGKSPEPVMPTVTEKTIIDKVDKKPEPKTNSQPTLLDAIEMKMNELHGIPFVERPPHELPRPYATESVLSKTEVTQTIPPKVSKIPNLLPLPKSQQKLSEDVINLESKEKSSISCLSSSKTTEKSVVIPTHEANASKDKIITEREFDKFARRNSVTYEDRLTITDSHQVIQTVVPMELPPKKISRNEQMLAEAKAKSPHKHLPVKQYHPSKAASKYIPVETNKQYQSKLQLAYQTAISVSTKRRIESPITIIEDKPVKVVYLDSNVSEFNSTQLNVQGRDLSPAKRAPDPDAVTVGTGDSLDSDMLDALDDKQEEVKTKSKHQRKQVLTPVETPDLELIEPGDLGIQVSPKKKRKSEDRPERKQNLVPKKSYLLGRSVEEPSEVRLNPMPPVLHTDPVSAIDSLVKAAELLDQTETLNASIQSVDNSLSTPVKRGRGRPRKNPLPDAAGETTVSPQKKPRLIDAKVAKHITSSDDSSDDDSMIKENWTMGKINEKIVCPICNKLFRSENVVFKHVKHCTGPSPSRSDSGKRSPRRSRLSRESETKSRDSEPKSRGSRYDADEVDLSPIGKTPSKRNSKDSGKSSSSDDAIPIKNDAKEDEHKKTEPRKIIKPKLNPRPSSLVCEICNKSFRQLSYLVSHKLQHKKEDKKLANEPQPTQKSVFSCETCKKEFRKLHHLVQHRLIHNPVQSRALRKTSSEQKELSKHLETSKIDDQSAGFRCEPCDKSFRKLHHLVEHRETHDGINRQRSNSTQEKEKEKPTPPPQCDICKKTFRKLHHLIEHKEQHLETSSEKSDDQKSVKSALSTKDIIHECNLCYMVFPNEHSLNKHTVICLRKKRQSAAKQAAALQEKNAEESSKAELPEESEVEPVKDPQPIQSKAVEEKVIKPPEKPIDLPKAEEVKVPQIKEDPPKPAIVPTVEKVEKQIEPKAAEKKAPPPKNPTPKVAKLVETPAKVKQVEEIIVIEDTPKKKTPTKDKVVPSVTKRQKLAPPTEERTAPSSDEDEIRYMFNPDFKTAETTESKTFTKIRAKKRNSLPFEKPHKDVVRKRSLFQHPPKIPRLRSKSDDVPSPPTKSVVKSKIKAKVLSTDSDDSDVKYSFPKSLPEKPEKLEVPANDTKRRKTMAEKRKSLGAIAKRKSLGMVITKAAKPSPAKPIKRRTAVAEHRCDCGQLFSSAALLARHASLAHTPPRVRRPRDIDTAPPSRKASAQQSRKCVDQVKKSVKDVEKPSKSVQQPRKSVDQVKKSGKDASSVEQPRKSVDKSRKSVDQIKKSGKDAGSVEQPRKSVEKSRKSVEKSRQSVDQVKKSGKDVSVEQKKVVSGKDSVRKSVKKTASARDHLHAGVPLPDKRLPRK